MSRLFLPYNLVRSYSPIINRQMAFQSRYSFGSVIQTSPLYAVIQTRSMLHLLHSLHLSASTQLQYKHTELVLVVEIVLGTILVSRVVEFQRSGGFM